MEPWSPTGKPPQVVLVSLRGILVMRLHLLPSPTPPPPLRARSWYCGASLIRPRLLVTAAHCLFDDSGQRTDPTVVYIGMLDIANDGLYEGQANDKYDRRVVKVRRWAHGARAGRRGAAQVPGAHGWLSPPPTLHLPAFPAFPAIPSASSSTRALTTVAPPPLTLR